MAYKTRYAGNGAPKNKSIIKKTAVMLLAVVLLAAAALTGLDIAGRIAGGSNTEDNRSSGFPVYFNTNDVIKACPMGKNIVVLTKKLVTAVSNNGEIIWQNPLSFGDPAVYCNDNYCLVYDRLSNKYAVIEKDGEMRQSKQQETQQIYSAVITRSGKVLMSVKSDSSACLVGIADKKGENSFLWSCSDEYAVTLGLSSDEKTLYCGCISAASGEAYTKVYALGIKTGEEKSCVIKGAAPIAINNIYSDKINLLTTDGIYILDSSKQDMLVSSSSFSTSPMFYSGDGKGNIAVITSQAGKLSQNRLTVFSKKGEVEYSVDIEDDVTDIFFSKGSVVLLYEDDIVEIKKGEITHRYSASLKSSGVLLSSGEVFCYSLGGVDKAHKQ